MMIHQIRTDNTFSHGYALLIGVGASAYAPWSLPVTVKDVQALRDILTDPALCAYPADHIRLLHDAGATRQAILDGLGWLAQQVAADGDATAVVYFSGHGWLDEATGRYCLLPHDVEPFDLAGSALPAEAFTAALRKVMARRLLVLMDCCHAAGMATAKDAPALKLPAGFAQVALPKGVTEALKQGAGRAVISSSTGAQRSWVRPDGTLSLFTYHLLEALQGAGNRPGDAEVRVSNLMAHLSRAVPASARTLCGAEQTPFLDAATEDFPVAPVRGARGCRPAGGRRRTGRRLLASAAWCRRSATTRWRSAGVSAEAPSSPEAETGWRKRKMVDKQKMQDILKRVVAGEYSDQDLAALRHAIAEGQVTLATGERAVAVGGNVSDVVLITGGCNIIIKGASATSLRALLGEASERVPSADHQELERTLQMARRALAILEEQAAGFGTLHIPAHLRIELEEKRREVAELEQRLKEYKQVPAYPVVPLGINLPERKPPFHLTLPPGYRYLGQLDGLTTDHLYRERDGHVVLWFPTWLGVSKPYLIDKYDITARQFSDCLNDLLHQGIAQLEHHPTSGVQRCVDWQGRPLAFDALDCWQRGPTPREPWQHAAAPWGMTCQNGLWQPIPGSELLPATLVTWWGARLYSLWANQQPIDLSDERIVYLPTVQQWEAAALWDILARRQRRYPWGETWQREWVNYAGYWAGREVREADWERLWATQSDIYRQTRPLPVANLNEGRSPIGCVQMIGNVWEWCADTPVGGLSVFRAVKGGACLSPQEHCSPDWQIAWRAEQGNEYVGFRCCFPLAE